MKKITFLLSILACLFIAENSFSQTYDLTTITNNGVNGVSETLSGVTMTVVTKNNGTNNTSFGVVSAFGTNGVAFHASSSQNTEEMTISFDATVNVNTIRVISDNTYSRTWTFTATGGSNTAVMETGTFVSSTDVALNFTGITAITITSNFSGGNQERIVFDQLTVGAPLSLEDFHLRKTILVFPNPSNNFLQIPGLTKPENYRIFNIIGAEISSGKITSNEKIDIQNFTKGLYIIQFDDGSSSKFIKK